MEPSQNRYYIEINDSFEDEMPIENKTVETKPEVQKADKKVKVIRENTDSTLSAKYTTPNDLIRKHKVSYKEGKTESDKMDFVKKTLDSAYSKQDREHFKKAAALYHSAIEKDAKKYISTERFRVAKKEVFICELEVWKNSKKRREKYLDAARTSLESNLEGNTQTLKTKKELINTFAIEVNAHALSLIAEDPTSAMKLLTYLFEFDTKNQKLIDKAIFTSAIDDILHNMTVCILNEKAQNGQNVENMVNLLKLVLENPSINQDMKDTYNAWLETEYGIEDITELFELTDEQIRAEEEEEAALLALTAKTSEDSEDNGQYIRDINVEEDANFTFADFLAAKSFEVEAVGEMEVENDNNGPQSLKYNYTNLIPAGTFHEFARRFNPQNRHFRGRRSTESWLVPKVWNIGWF